MTYSQYAARCAEHLNCTVIVGEGTNEEGAYVTESHMTADVRPEARLNLDYPVCDDRRDPDPKNHGTVTWELADVLEQDVLGWPDETRRRVAFGAAARDLHTLDEAAAKLGMSRAELVDEAFAKGWHRELGTLQGELREEAIARRAETEVLA